MSLNFDDRLACIAMRCREKKHNSLIKTTSIFPEHGQKMSMSRYQYRIVTKQSFDKGLLPIIFEEYRFLPVPQELPPQR